MTRFEREHYDLVPAPRRPFTKLDEVSGTRLLDVATGPNALVAEAANRGAPLRYRLVTADDNWRGDCTPPLRAAGKARTIIGTDGSGDINSI
jgi:hypothetical protein